MDREDYNPALPIPRCATCAKWRASDGKAAGDPREGRHGACAEGIDQSWGDTSEFFGCVLHQAFDVVPAVDKDTVSSGLPPQ